MNLLPVVEGVGDERAVPILIRRILQAHGKFNVGVLHPHRRGEYPNVAKRLDDYIAVAQKEGAPIIWVLDFDCADCICVKETQDYLKARLKNIYLTQPVEFCFTVKEFECLFLCDPTTVRNVLQIPATYSFPNDPENLRSAKEFLSRGMGIRAYKETIHQEKLAAQVNLDVLRAASRSFRHLEAAVLRLT